VLLFQVLDAFLGLDVYLSKEVREGTIPRLQREFCAAVQRASFRHRLKEEGIEGQIKDAFREITKQLRVSVTPYGIRNRYKNDW